MSGWESLGEIIARLRDAIHAMPIDVELPEPASEDERRAAWLEAMDEHEDGIQQLTEEAEAARARLGDDVPSVDELIRAEVERENTEHLTRPRPSGPEQLPPWQRPDA